MILSVPGQPEPISDFPTPITFSLLTYSLRVWFDSAGPTYFAQVKGLLGYGVPTSQLVFGSVSQITACAERGVLTQLINRTIRTHLGLMR